LNTYDLYLHKCLNPQNSIDEEILQTRVQFSEKVHNN
jgi:hypothetical protein